MEFSLIALTLGASIGLGFAGAYGLLSLLLYMVQRSMIPVEARLRR